MNLTLALLPDTFAICLLDRDAPVPAWANQGAFYSITRTPDELSIVCAQSNIPDGVNCEKEFRCLQIEGKLDFSEIGIVASLATTLAQARISIFVISTYDTDYILVQNNNLENAIRVLTQEGHSVRID